MLSLLDEVQPWLNGGLALTAGSVGLWATIHQHRLKRGGLLWSYIGNISLILIAFGLPVTRFSPDNHLVRAFLLRVLFLLVYVAWGVKSLHHYQEWRRTIRSVASDGPQ